MFFTYKRHDHYNINRLSSIITLLLFSFFSAFSHADESSLNAHISFEKPWIRLLPPTVMHTAGYVTINNSLNTPDTLLNVWSPAINSVSIHQTKEVNGVFKMLPAENLVIPAGGQLIMKPGSYHLMMMGLEQALTSDSEVTICFKFEKAGIVHVIFPTAQRQIN